MALIRTQLSSLIKRRTKMTKDNTTTGKKPTHYAYQVREGKDKSFFTRIGVVFAHKDGQGFNILLDSIPLDGKVTLRNVAENE